MSFLGSMEGLLGRVVPLVCSGDELIAHELGLGPWQFAWAKAAVYIAFLIPVLLAWSAAWPRLRRHGFAKPVWRSGQWMLLGVAIFQAAKTLAVPVIGDIIPCPYDLFAGMIVAFLVLYAGFFWHLGHGNKGSFGSYLLLMVGPLAGEVAVNSREAGISGVRMVLRAAEFAMYLFARLHAA